MDTVPFYKVLEIMHFRFVEKLEKMPYKHTVALQGVMGHSQKLVSIELSVSLRSNSLPSKNEKDCPVNV
jgi:hypothetical protein